MGTWSAVRASYLYEGASATGLRSTVLLDGVGVVAHTDEGDELGIMYCHFMGGRDRG